MTKIAVTGAGGFIGRVVVEKLVHGDHEVTAIGRHVEQAGFERHRRVEIDVRDAGPMIKVLAGHDLVIHLASRTGGIQMQGYDDILANNANGAESVARASAISGVDRVFLASSAAVYRTQSRALSEEDPVVSAFEGDALYARSKATEEGKARDSFPPVLIGRLTNVYGPGGHFGEERATVVHDLIRRATIAARSAVPLLGVWGDGTAVRSFMYIDDAASAVIAVALTGTPGEIYNIDTGQPSTIASLAKTIASIVSPQLDIAFDVERPTGAPVRYLDPGRLFGLGFRPKVDLIEGLQRTVAAYTESQPSCGS